MTKGLPQTEALLTELVTSDQKPASPTEGRHFLSEDGGLHLTAHESRMFDRAVSELLAAFAAEEDIGRRTVTRALWHASVQAVDPAGLQPEVRPLTRIAESLESLRRDLSKPTIDFTVYVPVGGWDPSDLPRTFGNARITRFGEYHLSQLRRDVARHLVGADQSTGHIVVRDIRTSPLWLAPCAIVAVSARDTEAALVRATTEARLTLDCVGAFSAFLRFSYGQPFVVGDNAPASVTTVLRPDGTAPSPHFDTAGFASFKLENLPQNRPAIRRAFKRVSAALRMRRQRPKAVDGAIVSAAQWIGRAGANRHPAEAFLQTMIALETTVLPVPRKGAMGYRIPIRVAHLIGTTPEARRRIRDEVRKLYGIRNAIVHDGRYEVLKKDLDSARWHARSALIQALTHRATSRFTLRSELEEWLDAQVV